MYVHYLLEEQDLNFFPLANRMKGTRKLGHYLFPFLNQEKYFFGQTKREIKTYKRF